MAAMTVAGMPVAVPWREAAAVILEIVYDLTGGL